MLEQKDKPNLSGITQSLQTIHHFLDNFPPEELDKQCWELVHHAFASDEADSWSKNERCTVLFLYEELRNLGLALTVIDKELMPLFVKE